MYHRWFGVVAIAAAFVTTVVAEQKNIRIVSHSGGSRNENENRSEYIRRGLEPQRSDIGELDYSFSNATIDITGGDVTARIVGGNPVAVGEYPYFVHMGGCAGSLISPLVVLTAAHCGPENYVGGWVEIGTVSRFNGDGTRINVIASAKHPSYAIPTQLNFDYGLLLLETPYVMNSTIKLELNDDDAFPVPEEILYAMGMGATEYEGELSEQLLHVQLPAISNTQCKSLNSAFDRIVTENIICAGYLNQGKDACQGDSGAPMVKKDGNKHIQVGLVSGGIKCGNFPGIYARISGGVGWIRSIVCEEWNAGSADLCDVSSPPPPPTVFPTRNPSSTPVQRPTSAPVPQPTSSALADDPNFKYKGKKQKGCKWVKRNMSKRCKKKIIDANGVRSKKKIYTACSVTCQAYCPESGCNR